MINKSIIKKIGDKEMDRKDFLKYSGIVIASAVGLKGLLSLISLSQVEKGPVSTTIVEKPRGFGSGKYGA